MNFIKKNRVAIIIAIIGFFLIFLFSYNGSNQSMTNTQAPQNAIYRYTIDAGGPTNYPMIYSYHGSFFADKQGKPFLNFYPPGGSVAYWSYGGQATLASERNILPSSMQVRWFSVAENQFWQGNYTFDENLLKTLVNYQVIDILSRDIEYFGNYLSFTVYVIPGGLVSVWANGGGERYLVGQFQAKKMAEEPDWKYFYQTSIINTEKIEPRDVFIKEYMKESLDYIKETFNNKAELFNTEQPKDKPLTSEPWHKLMKKYNWALTVDDRYFTLRDYRVAFVNGEIRYVYSGDNQLVEQRPAPDYIIFYFQNKQNNNIPERIDMQIDDEEVMSVFKEISLTPPLDEPINLFLDIKTDLSDLHAYVIKGDKKIQLKKIKPRLVDLYNGKNESSPWPEQTKNWK